MPVILFCTVLASVSLGVFFGYITVLGILYSFGRPRQPASTGRPRLVLVPTQNHASGD